VLARDAHISEFTSGKPGFSYLSVSHFDLAKATQNRDQAVRESCRRTMGSLLKAVPPLMGNSDVLRDQVAHLTVTPAGPALFGPRPGL